MIRPLFILRFTGIALLLGHLLVWYPAQAIHSDYANTDVALFHLAATRVANGQPIYGETRTNVSQLHNAFFYPPTFAVMIRPAAALSLATTAKIWYAIILVSFWMLAWALARIAVPHRYRIDHVLAIGTCLQFVPYLHWAMSLGNVDIVVWALVAWALSVRTVVVGVVLLLFASWIKVYPIFGIPILLLRHGIRYTDEVPAFVGVAVFLSGLLVTMAVFDVSGYGDQWAQTGIPSVSAGCLHSRNFSLTTLLIRPFVDADAATIPRWAQRFLSIAPLVGIAGVAIAATRKTGPRAHTAVVIIAALWFSPVCWRHQLGIASIGLALWWAHRYRPTREHFRAARDYLLDTYHDQKRERFVMATFAASPHRFRAYQAAVALGADTDHAAEETFPEIKR